MLPAIISHRQLLAVVTLLAVTRHRTESDAMSLTGVAPENRQYMRMLYHGEDFFLAGAKNALYNISSRTMAVQAEFRWLSSLEANESCKQDLDFFNSDCNSYVRLVLPHNDSYYLVCASSAKMPACRPLTLTQGVWSLGAELNDDPNIPRQAYAPIFPSENSVTHVSKENTVYASTTYYYDAQPFHILFRNQGVSPGGATIGQMTTPTGSEYINEDTRFGVKPQFVATFETAGHVYTIFTEPALETYNLLHQKAVYSRIARVCKNDMGSSGSDHTFSTYFKARMLCGMPQASNGKGSYPYYFDEVASVSQPHKSSRTGEEVIVAVFNSPRNSVRGSAICEFKVADIEKTFDESPQMMLTGNEEEGYVWKLRDLVGRPPAKCPENTRDLAGDEVEKTKHPLLRDHVRAVDDATVFSQSNVHYRMTQLRVDWQVKGANGTTYDIIFVSTDDGRLLKLVEYGNGAGLSARYHLVEERRVFHSGEAITEMDIITDSDGEKHIILNTYNEMKRVALQKCHNHLTCGECVKARDPYCSWSLERTSCVSAPHGAGEKFQSVATGTDERCQLQQGTTDKMMVSQVPLKSDTTSVSGVIIKGVSASKQGDAGMKSATVTGLAIGIVLCALVFTGIGFVFGIYYNRQRGRNLTRHLDRLSKNKDDTYKADTDAYQPMPNLTKSNNIVYQNNLSTKLQNGSVDTAALPNGGESTLQRHKKSYV